MNVAFFGTSDRSEPILEALRNHFNLCLCVTKSSRRVGRHQRKEDTLVKKWASEKNIDVFEIDTPKNKDTLNALSKALSKRKVGLIVVADFGFILPKTFVEEWQGKIINIHFSLLPKYRGANPVQAAIIQGEEETGITFLLMSPKMDAGPLLYQVKHKLTGKETSGELYEILFEKAAKHLPDVIKKYKNGHLNPRKQEEKKARYYFSPSHPQSTYIYKEDAKIDWNEPAEKIERKIRAFNPWPIAWTTLNELENATNNEESPLFNQNFKLKKNIDKNLRLKIYNAELDDGKLKPKKVQVEGKNIIDWESFKNGYAIPGRS